ncbi:MAG: glycosyltransferase family 87 protein [Pseudomonadota bacterium]
MSRERLFSVILTLWMVLLLGWWAVVTIHYYQNDQQGMLLDFSAFWSAGQLALAGEPLTVWDKAAFQAAQNTGQPADGSYLPWFYPPTFHMAVTPFGALPFPLAFGLWSLLGVGCFWWMMRSVNPTGFEVTVVAPVVFLSMALGNNALLFGATLAFALSNLSRGAPAGLAISALSLKPGLGPVIALALLAGRRWSVILWASIGTISLAAIATGLFGIAYWEAFFANLSLAVERITPTNEETRRMISWYALARFNGWGEDMAMNLHLGLLAVVAAGTALIWARVGISPDLRAAALCLAVALTSPHAFHYEMIYALVAIAFLIRCGLGPVGYGVCGLLWLGPIVQVMEEPALPIVSFAPPLLTASFAYVVIRALRD